MVIEVQVLGIEGVVEVMVILVENTEILLLQILLYKSSHCVFITATLSPYYN